MVGQQQHEFEVVLRRDNLSTPWGFRLQGGRECQAPLTVQRVFVGGVSDGHLQRGDVITSIEQYDATQILHKQAEDLIRAARNTMSLTVRRGQPASYSGYDDSPKQSAFHQQTSGSWPPSAPSDGNDDDYSVGRSVAERRQKFSSPPAVTSHMKPGVIHTHPQPGMPSYVPKRPAIWKKKEPLGAGLSDPGWVPQPGGSGSLQRRQQEPSRQYTPLRPRSPPAGGHRSSRAQSAPQHLSPPPPQPASQPHEPPAWAGSLRRSGGPRQWELEEGEQLLGGGPRSGRKPSPQLAVQHVPAVVATGGEPVVAHNPRLQSVRYGPGAGGPVYEQHNAAGHDSDTARVAHLQYNTPIGLYSRQNAEEALSSQTRGKAGYGTMQIAGGAKAFDPSHSDVLRLVAEEDEIRKHGPAVHQKGPSRTGNGPAVASRPQQRQYEVAGGSGPQQYRQQQQQQQYGFEQQFGDVGISDF
jgi:hypothetical protein